MVATQIEKISSARAASLYDSDKSINIPRKKKARTGILRSNKGPQKKAHKNHSTQIYCILCKKAGMTEQRYVLHNVEDCTVICTNRTIMDGMRGSMGSRADIVKQYKKTKNEWKKELKYLKKQNKMLNSTAKKSGSRR